MSSFRKAKEIFVSAGHRPTLLHSVIWFLVISFALVGIVYPPSAGWDASLGFLVLKSMQDGASPNHLRLASPANIAEDQEVFWAAHAPGQYLFPALLNRLGFSLGRSLWLINTFAVCIGLIGYHKLFRQQLMFSSVVSLASCLVMVLHPAHILAFVGYSGGPILQFAGLPWFIILSLKCLRGGWSLVGWFALVFLASIALKLSFVLIGLSVLGAHILERHATGIPRMRLRLLLRSGLEVVVFGAAYLLLSFLFTSRGWTVVDPNHVTPTGAECLFFIAYSVSAVASSTLSIFWAMAVLGSPLHFMPSVTGWVHLLIVPIIVFAALSACLVTWVLARNSEIKYRSLLVSFAMVHVILLSHLFYNGGLALEDRHFWPVGALVLPGAIVAVNSSASKWIRPAFGVTLVAFMMFGLTTYVLQLERLVHSGRSRLTGIAVLGCTQRLIDLVESLDAELPQGRNVFVFAEPKLAMLVHKNATVLEFDGTLTEGHYSGAADRVIAVVREARAKSIPLAFKSETDWYTTNIDHHWIYVSGKDWPGGTYLRATRRDPTRELVVDNTPLSILQIVKRFVFRKFNIQ